MWLNTPESLSDDDAAEDRPHWFDLRESLGADDGSGRGAAILRCVFGNPFRPCDLDPAWLTPTVFDLANAAYEHRALPAGTLDPVRLAVLSDALEEAGCDDADMLSHLRDPRPHVRGCWVVDLASGREKRHCGHPRVTRVGGIDAPTWAATEALLRSLGDGQSTSLDAGDAFLFVMHFAGYGYLVTGIGEGETDYFTLVDRTLGDDPVTAFDGGDTRVFARFAFVGASDMVVAAREFFYTAGRDGDGDWVRDRDAMYE